MAADPKNNQGVSSEAQQGAETEDHQGVSSEAQQGAETEDHQGVSSEAQQGAETEDHQGVSSEAQQGAETEDHQGVSSEAQQGADMEDHQGVSSEAQQGAETEAKDLGARRVEALANLSHELKTPLTLILGPTERLVQDPHLSEDARRDLQVVQRNAWTLLRHVEDLLDLARGEVGTARLAYADLDLASLTRLTAEHFEALAADRGMTLEVQTPPTLPAQADPDKVERILLNLLFNAFLHTPSGGTIRCALAVDTSLRVARLSVADDGPGVAPELREAVFEPYHTGRAGKGGVGLGLSIARHFARLHGGEVTLGESPEGGALFTVSLPLDAPADVESSPKGGIPGVWATRVSDLARQAWQSDDAGEDARPVVAVLGTDGAWREAAIEALPEGARVTSYDHSETALAAAVETPPDVLLAELAAVERHLPRLAHLLEEHPQLPVLVWAPNAPDARRVSLLEMGVTDVFDRAPGPAELRARVRHLSRRCRSVRRLEAKVSRQREDLAVLARDVTRRQWELRTALDEARVARDLALRASRIKSNFLRMMSHELRTPVTAMQLQLTLLQRDNEEPLGPRQAALVERVMRSSRRLLDLIESALEYARVESGRYRARPSAFALDEVMADVAQEFGSFSGQKGLALLTRFQATPPLVSDRQLVRLIAVNLVGNALKHTEAGQVVLSVRHDGEAHWLEVADTGPGMTTELLEELFDPFRQPVDLRSRRGPGSGLGLTIVNELARALGGEISVQSSPGEGSTFSVRLPELHPAPEGRLPE